ncbi:hypothetical protein [Staphylococcus sp. GDK8D68P]|uniref:hypothetical protein n=1 Tax=Staphylococcus sp. GDK8D68P TaxID=2804092 RepID=UPI00194ED02F|nr:hypothetical protein [Staphylococcus sp. GDK8D68P]
MNILNAIGHALLSNIVAILFLLGLALLNLGTYLQFNTVIGLFATGFSLILIALIYQYEKASMNQ